jgi:hypothetical protein
MVTNIKDRLRMAKEMGQVYVSSGFQVQFTKESGVKTVLLAMAFFFLYQTKSLRAGLMDIVSLTDK